MAGIYQNKIQTLDTNTHLSMCIYFLTLTVNFLLSVMLLDACPNKYMYTPSSSPVLTGIDWMTAGDIVFRYTFETKGTDTPPSKQKPLDGSFHGQIATCEIEYRFAFQFTVYSILPCINSQRYTQLVIIRAVRAE